MEMEIKRTKLWGNGMYMCVCCMFLARFARFVDIAVLCLYLLGIEIYSIWFVGHSGILTNSVKRPPAFIDPSTIFRAQNLINSIE